MAGCPRGLNRPQGQNRFVAQFQATAFTGVPPATHPYELPKMHVNGTSFGRSKRFLFHISRLVPTDVDMSQYS